jgi:glycosyltransferase involved in cell wall biosynthesis
MNNEILLSIAIPTFNGSKYLQDTLESIVPQILSYPHNVDVVISDNASEDNTKDIVKKYQEKYQFIKYFRNDVNVGPDKNFDLAIRRSGGKYVWLFSDDDLLQPGSIEAVINTTTAFPELEIIWINYGLYNEDLSECRVYKRDLIINEDTYCNSAERYYEITGILSTGCATNIVKRESWCKNESDSKVGSSFIHVEMISNILIQNPKSFIIVYPFVKIRQREDSRWSQKGKILFLTVNLTKIFKSNIDLGYSKKGMEDVIKKEIFKDLLNVCIIAKKQNIRISLKFIKELINCYSNFPKFWLIILPVVCVPNLIFNKSLNILNNTGLFKTVKIFQ